MAPKPGSKGAKARKAEAPRRAARKSRDRVPPPASATGKGALMLRLLAVLMLAGAGTGAYFANDSMRGAALDQEAGALLARIQGALADSRFDEAERLLDDLSDPKSYGASAHATKAPELRRKTQDQRAEYRESARNALEIARELLNEGLKERDLDRLRQAREKYQEIEGRFTRGFAPDALGETDADLRTLKAWEDYLGAIAKAREQIAARDIAAALDLLNAALSRGPDDDRHEARNLDDYYRSYAKALEALAAEDAEAAVEALVACRDLTQEHPIDDVDFAASADRAVGLHLRRAREAQDAEDYDAAQAAYSAAAQAADALARDQAPARQGESDVRYQRAVTHARQALQDRDFATAAQAFSDALGYRSGDPEAKEGYAEARYQEALDLGAKAEARQDFDEARRLYREARALGTNVEELDRRIDGLILRQTLDTAEEALADVQLSDQEKLDRVAEALTTIEQLEVPEELRPRVEALAEQRRTLDDAVQAATRTRDVAHFEAAAFQPGLGGAGALEAPGVELTLPAFAIARFEVKNSEFQAFVDAGGYTTEAFWDPAAWALLQAQAPPFVDSTGALGPATWTAGRFHEGQGDLPVRGVSWYEAEAFCRFLTATRDDGRYRLPTEAQWERACKGSATTRFPWGSDDMNENLIHAGKGAAGAPVAVTTFDDPGIHPEGLCHMLGNVAEWTADWYGSYQQKYPPESGRMKVVRGGSFADAADSCTPTARSFRLPSQRPDTVGFRWVRLEK